MQLDFSGQTALVTGASRGIGSRIARDLADSGARLVVTSRSAHDGPRLANELGSGTVHHPVDFADAGAMDAFLTAVRALPQLHVCINNAGTTRHGPMLEASPEDWDETVTVDLRAPFFVTQAAAEVMKNGEYGRIVNVSSIWAHITMAGRSIYTAAKFGLRGMSLTHAVELARWNILVNVVAPGFTRTDMVERNYSAAELNELSARIPLGRLADVGDISRAVLFLASDLNRYITGQSLVVDGGYSIT